MVKRSNWEKAKLPPISDAIPQAALPSQAGYDEKMRDNSAAQRQALLQFEDATLGEWFTAPVRNPTEAGQDSDASRTAFR